ncbi:NADH-quinone oxidoreductase subunit K [Saccharicrinis aurantiacus]|uniref:NADH-quinone oxidoreductase subunit K n=1 Tax=Saccharicrinis aurantiacus TaxID=1849719 RepID=UPI00094F690D|nr:NADH-quinone oxidoreductase subunit K [Saccharicrinis aurantiacus]
MEILLVALIGLLYAGGVYLILRRSLLKFIIGIIFLSNATNLLVFISAGIVHGKPAFVTGGDADPSSMADPLPQALVLTAIVIGFGIVIFTLALKSKFYSVTDKDDSDEIKETDI